MRWSEIIESATCGATGAASVATVVGGLGAGFDPNGDKGIYQKAKKKPLLIRRISEAAHGKTLSDLCTIKTDFPDADFWLVRRGTEDTVGKPVKEFDPQRIGIKVERTDVLDPNYLFYLMQHLQNRGVFKSMATGSIRLVHITTGQIKSIPLG